MTVESRRGILAAATALVLLASGLVVGIVVGDALADDAAPQRSASDPAMAWVARGLLALAVAWIVIGMLSARTRLVRRPGAAAARASWIAATRPWQARESTLGMLELDRWLLLGVPAASLVATCAVETAFLGWWQPVTAFVAWTVFLGVVRIFVGRRSPWPVIAAVGGVVVLRCILTLVLLSLSGPGGSWLALWTSPAPRILYLVFVFALWAWAFVAAGWALATQIGPRRATGAVIAAIGAALAVPAAIVALAAPGAGSSPGEGLREPAHGLAWILGVAARPGIPADVAWWAAGLGLLVCGLGVLLASPRSPQQHSLGSSSATGLVVRADREKTRAVLRHDGHGRAATGDRPLGTARHAHQSGHEQQPPEYEQHA